jgi:DNA polymerase-3 subunit beta
VPFESFVAGVNTAGAIIAQDDKYPLYNCINVTAKPTSILFESVGSRNRRMVVFEENVTTKKTGSFFAEYQRLKKICTNSITPGNDVQIDIADNGVLISIGTMKVFTRLISGSFPDCMKLIPASFITTFNFNRTDLLAVLERAKVLVDDKTKAVTLKITSSTNDPANSDAIEVAVSSAFGSMKEYVVPTSFSGKDIEISFRIYSLIDGLRNMTDQTITWMFPNLNTSIFSSVSSNGCHYYLTPAVRNTAAVQNPNKPLEGVKEE